MQNRIWTRLQRSLCRVFCGVFDHDSSSTAGWESYGCFRSDIVIGPALVDLQRGGRLTTAQRAAATAMAFPFTMTIIVLIVSHRSAAAVSVANRNQALAAAATAQR